MNQQPSLAESFIAIIGVVCIFICISFLVYETRYLFKKVRKRWTRKLKS